ncbi:SUKH-4 family immunity protein [Streptomyces sp. Tu 6176]|uniref:SUKH-4 family immunity protein n=1 Tax=Streptomyces sp. Tu 6176 TaxID=1470557 RepID=UPI001319E6CB|nr:SUKH-4 family immunity protein [Streptomyces sp. Tu 6176]
MIDKRDQGLRMRFELTEVSGYGLSVNVPDSFFFFKANDGLERLTSGSGEVYYQFWRRGHDVGVYLHGESGRVFAGASLNDLVFANSSVDCFTECVEKITERSPFYSEDADLEECELAARALEGVVFGIDPSAIAEGTFWSDIISDISIGDYFE